MSHPDAARLVAGLETVILGKRPQLELLVVGVLAEGHVLMEDVPGVGKTTLARALARSLALDFKRVQFTPDLMPADITGAAVLHPEDGRFEFRPGPAFTHILLADEINRASPRTQSALLEAMSERQITADGVTRPLPRPYFVVATQNPADYQGTYPLPEAQLDRFLLRIRLGYPEGQSELDMLYAQRLGHPLDRVEPVLDGPALTALQDEVRRVHVEEPVGRYLLDLARRTRAHPDLALGASPRAALALFRAAQARALLAGRDYATPGDVQALADAVLAHRLVLRPKAEYAGRTTAQVVAEIVAAAPVPT
ncbi:MAG: MoxR family ATPase [Myxococcales bacterium]|nr:MoxR family ATPase [Myxococcales bacterium]MCB9543891.1 MoxR family ATPase [Myxococcales bacterium]